MQQLSKAFKKVVSEKNTTSINNINDEIIFDRDLREHFLKSINYNPIDCYRDMYNYMKSNRTLDIEKSNQRVLSFLETLFTI